MKDSAASENACGASSNFLECVLKFARGDPELSTAEAQAMRRCLSTMSRTARMRRG